jgi:uracil-DNA glycosylase family 4
VTDDERRRALEAIAGEIRTCTRCRLAEGRTNAVPGEGTVDTDVVFVGEGPGYHEDQQGRPFVGPAGQLLDALLAAIGWRREDVFITNIVKCRPPGNRDPLPDEVAACAPFLRRQLEVLDPPLVVTLGRHSLARFLPGARIGQAHGTLQPADPTSGLREAFVYAAYHPAAALHQQAMRRALVEDVAGIPEALIAARDGRRRLRAAPVSEAAPFPESSPAPEEPASLHRAQTAEPAPLAEPDTPGQLSLFIGEP